MSPCNQAIFVFVDLIRGNKNSLCKCFWAIGGRIVGKNSIVVESRSVSVCFVALVITVVTVNYDF